MKQPLNKHSTLFAGFEQQKIRVAGGEIRISSAGTGTPLLLLHGNPQTHVMWHAVVADLVRDYKVICADLRGYGQSFKPPVSDDHLAYSKRAMALDMIQLMLALGHEEFYLAGHDRGARVAHRLALDHPRHVRKLSLLDIVPTIEHFERADMAFAMGYAHWFWLAQPHPIPETLINASPEEWFFGHTSREPKQRDFFNAEALRDYLDAVKNPEVITAICEDYRAAATIDLVHDRESRDKGVKIQCPLQILWGAKGKIEQWYEPMEIWGAYCDNTLQGHAIATGHYLAEEAPDRVVDEFRLFFRIE